MAAAPDDASRRRALGRARRRATGLLLVVTMVFLATFALPDDAWVGWVRAAAEAAMVGGLADWFAVVALFRHPLGVPIPHTAVIPRSKDGLGANLATFVSDNFLDPDDLVTRLTDADMAARAGAWLVHPGNAEVTAARVADLLAGSVRDADPDQVVDVVADMATRSIDALPAAELAGQGLAAAIGDGRHHEVLTAAVLGIRRALHDNESMLRERLYRESPRWVPPALDDIVFDRALSGLTRFLTEVADDPGHPVRGLVDERLAELATSLQQDPATIEAIRTRLRGLVDEPVVRTWARGTWEEVGRVVAASATDPTSPLRANLAGRLVDLGRRLQEDPAVRASVDSWIASVAPAVARESRVEIAALVSATVDRWDPDETSDRLELWLGTDLQFVRINGTVVGGLVGLVLHGVTLLLG